MYRLKRKVILETGIYRAFHMMISTHGDQIVHLPVFQLLATISLDPIAGFDPRVGNFYFTNLNCEMGKISNLLIQVLHLLMELRAFYYITFITISNF